MSRYCLTQSVQDYILRYRTNCKILANKRDFREMNKREQAYSVNYSAKNSNADASLDRSPSPTTAKSGSQVAPLNEAEIRARLDQFAKELAQAQRDRARH